MGKYNELSSTPVDHWNGIYQSSKQDKLGWYQKIASPSLKLIEQCKLKSNDLILDVGSGGSVLIDNLLSLGYSSIVANDISEVALKVSQKRLGRVQAAKVKWVIDDILKANSLTDLTNVALWHDRALFHFFTKEKEKDEYIHLLNQLVKRGGFVILAAFNLESAEKCSGLRVKCYDVNLLKSSLGESYQLIDWFNYQYTMPSGDIRPYVYSLFRKI